MVLALILVVGTSYAQTQSPDLKNLEKEAGRLDADAAKMSGSDAPLVAISKQLGIPIDTLKNEKQSTNFGYGQLFIANALAQSTGKSFDQLAQEFQQGKGWGEIAKENGVKLGHVVSGIKHADKQMKHEHQSQLRAQHNMAAQQNRASGHSPVRKGSKR